jgi:hypothetical protein
MRRLISLFALVLSTFSGLLLGQHAVDPAHRYFRLIALVPLTGTGTRSDPIRPRYVPNVGDALSRDGIIAWSSQLTDDGHKAIIHIAAVNHRAFDAILADPNVTAFEIGKADPAAIVTALQQFRQNFTLDSLKVVAQ